MVKYLMGVLVLVGMLHANDGSAGMDVKKFIQGGNCDVSQVVDGEKLKVFRACSDTYVFKYTLTSISGEYSLDSAKLINKDGVEIVLYK